jgi:hypothetical protein
MTHTDPEVKTWISGRTLKKASPTSRGCVAPASPLAPTLVAATVGDKSKMPPMQYAALLDIPNRDGMASRHA